MTDEVIYYRFRFRGGTAADLATVNEIPLSREGIIESDTGLMKLGDGIRRYIDLPYFGGAIWGGIKGDISLQKDVQPFITAGSKGQFYRGDKTWSNTITGNLFGLMGNDPVEVSLNIGNEGGGTAVLHYLTKPSSGLPLKGSIVGGAGSRPWRGSAYTAHSTAAYHLLASEDHTENKQGTKFRIVATPNGYDYSARIPVADFNGDGDIINSKGLTEYKVNPTERGRGIEVVRNTAAEISMVGSEPSGYSTLFRGYSFGGGNVASPQATPANNGTGYALCGYDGANWTGAKALIAFRSAAAWTTTSTPTYADIETTAIGSTARTLRVRIMDNGAAFIANSSARSDNPAGGVYVYSENGSLKVKTPSGAAKEIAPDRSSVQASRAGAAVALTASAYATVIYDAENLDALSEYNQGNGIFVPVSTGLYMVQASCHLTGVGSSAEVVLRVRSNGSEVARVYNMVVANGGNMVANGVAIIQLNAGVSVDVQVYVASGSPAILAGSNTGTRLGIQRLA